MRYNWTSQSLSEHLRQADLSILALRVVTAMGACVLSGSLASHIERGLDISVTFESQGIRSPNVESQAPIKIYPPCPYIDPAGRKRATMVYTFPCIHYRPSDVWLTDLLFACKD